LVFANRNDPRFAAVNLEKDKHGDDYKATVEELEKGEEARQVFFKACLVKLGLQVNLSAQPVPSLSPLHLSCLNPSETSSLLSSWKDIISESPSKQLYIVGENDTFHIRNPPESLVQFAKPNTPDDLNLSSLTISDSENEAENFSGNDRIVDYDKMLKHLIIHMTEIPPYKETPQFNHAIYYASLSKFTGPRRTKSSFGEYLLYGEVVTSTSTILDK
jgi:biotin--protein ligase